VKPMIAFSRPTIRKVAEALMPRPMERFADRALGAAFEVVEFELEPRVRMAQSFMRRIRGDSIRYFDAATAFDDGESLTFARSRVKAPPRTGDFVLQRDRQDPSVIQVSTVRHVDRRGQPLIGHGTYRVICGYIGDAHDLRDRSYLNPNPREKARVQSALSREAGLGMKHAVAHL
jgi:hypothetical protein